MEMITSRSKTVLFNGWRELAQLESQQLFSMHCIQVIGARRKLSLQDSIKIVRAAMTLPASKMERPQTL